MLAGQEASAPQHRQRLPDGDQLLRELGQGHPFVVEGPVDPADLAVLPVGVVVAALGA